MAHFESRRTLPDKEGIVITTDFAAAFSRALVIGVFGGAGLILTQVYSRRGPLIFPVYAAILAALTLSLARAPNLPVTSRFVIALTSTLLATAMAFVATLVLAARARRKLVESGRQFAPGRAPAWGLPLILLILAAVSAGVAHVAA
jgi:hypothetical protein